MLWDAKSSSPAGKVQRKQVLSWFVCPWRKPFFSWTISSSAPADPLRGCPWELGLHAPSSLRSPLRRGPGLGSRQTLRVGLVITVVYSALIEEIQLLQSLKISLLTLFFLTFLFFSPKATRWRSSADSGNMETAPVCSPLGHLWDCQALTNVLRAHICRSPAPRV